MQTNTKIRTGIVKNSTKTPNKTFLFSGKIEIK